MASINITTELTNTFIPYIKETFTHTHVFGMSWVISGIAVILTMLLITRDLQKWKTIALPTCVIITLSGLQVSVVLYIIAGIVFAIDLLSLEVSGNIMKGIQRVTGGLAGIAKKKVVESEWNKMRVIDKAIKEGGKRERLAKYEKMMKSLSPQEKLSEMERQAKVIQSGGTLKIKRLEEISRLEKEAAIAKSIGKEERARKLINEANRNRAVLGRIPSTTRTGTFGKMDEIIQKKREKPTNRKYIPVQLREFDEYEKKGAYRGGGEWGQVFKELVTAKMGETGKKVLSKDEMKEIYYNVRKIKGK